MWVAVTLHASGHVRFDVVYSREAASTYATRIDEVVVVYPFPLLRSLSGTDFRGAVFSVHSVKAGSIMVDSSLSLCS